MPDNIALDQVGTGDSYSYNLISLYEDHAMDLDSLDSPFQYGNHVCECYEPDQFNVMTGKLHILCSS